MLGRERIPNEALNQALKLETAKAAAGPLAKLRELAGAHDQFCHLTTDERDAAYAGIAGPPFTCADCTRGHVIIRKRKE